MKNTKQWMRTFFLMSVMTAFACGEDGSSGETDATTGQGDGDVNFVCDPVGANPGVGGLLNAPPESDVEVIVKEAEHPGNPGPLELP